MALVNSFGALGGFAGAYVVGYLVGTPGGKGAASLFMACALAASAILMLVVARPSLRKLTGRVGLHSVRPNARTS